VNLLERELRSGEVDPTLLQELGWDNRRAAQFVEEFRRTKQGGQRQTAQSELPTEREVSTRPSAAPALLRGTAATGSTRAFRSDAQLSPDQMQGAADPARQRVPQRYRPLLEGYYRSITSQPGS
jgi:hypothetical protein